jgi:hypothetical protein
MARYAGAAVLNTDDRPVVAYCAPRIISADVKWRQPFP